MIEANIDYLSKEELDKLIKNTNKIRDKIIILCMSDLGLRVSETISLRLKNIDFKKRLVRVDTLKNKTVGERVIPISDRLYALLVNYIDGIKKSLNADLWLFPTSKKYDRHITRQNVWGILNRLKKKLDIDSLHPHALRHTFATHHISSGTSLPAVKKMLGHTNYNSTLVYTSVPLEDLRNHVDRVTNKKTFLSRFLNKKPKVKQLNIDFTNDYFSVGRNEELEKINRNLELGINTIVIGGIGVGKSHILDKIKTSKKAIKLDDTESIKKSLVQILLYLYEGDKKAVVDLVYKNFTIKEIEKRVQRENTVQLCDTIMALVEDKEYILFIDDITKITSVGKKVVERFKDKFTIVCGARALRIGDSSFLWNFEKIEIKNLKRANALKLIYQCSSGLEAENREVLYHHILEQSNGNPRAIIEICDRYRKEPYLSNEVVREVKHIGALPRFDCTFLVLVFLGLVACLRYFSAGMESPEFRALGGVAIIFLILSRPIFAKFKKSYI